MLPQLVGPSIHLPLHVLIVEDSTRDTDITIRQLRRAGFEPRWQRVETEEDFAAALRPGIDLIIADYSLPQFSGLRALQLLKSRRLDAPFIIVSGIIDAETAVHSLQAGAADYVMKDRIERLGSAVSRALEHRRLRRGYVLAEQAAAEGEKKFRALFDGAHDAIYMLYDGIFVDCNAKGLSMYGRSWNDIVGHTPDEFAPAHQPDGTDSRVKALRIIQRALAGEAQFFEWTSLHSNGAAVCTEVSLSRLELSGRIYLMAVSRDITERRQTEDRLMELAALLDQAQDAIAARDLEGNVVFWNKGAERLYGWSHEEVIGRNIGRLIYPDYAPFEEASRAVITQGDWSGEVQQVTRAGREIDVEARWTLLRDKDENPKLVLAINTDVTEKKLIEAQLMRSQRMESIGTLAGGIAHDLNNILTPILTSIEMLKLTEPSPRAQKILEAIETSSKRGADIVQQVLSFARGVKGQRIEVSPLRLLKDLEGLVRETFPKNISLELAQAKKCSSVLGDPTQLHQVLLNLVVNARDAMRNGGTLSISAEDRMIGEEDVVGKSDLKTGSYVVFTVTDTGDGIAPHLLDKIFEPFYTTKEIGKGTGLGLSTVLAIVRGHGGVVEVLSKPGAGARFEVFLPAMTVEAPIPEPARKRSSLPRGGEETILLVDDEPAILEVTGETLASFGYRVLKAQDGCEALDLFQQHRASISLVLTDMTMPNMDGAATIRVLSQIDPTVRIIASSGYMTPERADAESLARTKHFLPKPYTAETLLRTVQGVLEDVSDLQLAR